MTCEGDSMDRRLAAILAANVVGYSTLMERNETRTLSRLFARHTMSLKERTS